MSTSCKNQKIKKVMGEYKRGVLRNKSGQKVKKRKQAIAIALSEAEKMCNGLKYYMK
jgi:hypothetical protein